MLVRPANQSDDLALVEITRAFVNDDRDGGSRFKDVDFDAAKVYSLMSNAINNPDAYFLEVAVVDGEIVGGLFAEMQEYYFSRSKIAQDIALFMKSGFSNPRAVTTLVKNYISWAKKNGAFEAVLSTSTGIYQDGFAKLAKRRGFNASMFGYSRRL